jgi:hypothetical protein
LPVIIFGLEREPKARSRAGRYMFMTGRDDIPTINGAILNILQIIRAVMSTAVEAELGALFINTKTANSMRHLHEELGHPQPLTPMQTDKKLQTTYSPTKLCQRPQRQLTYISTGYNVAMLRDNSDITGDQAHRICQIISPSITRPVTTRPADPLS